MGARPCVRRPFTPGATTPQSCHPATCGACLSRRLCSPRAPGSTRRTRAPGLLYSCGWPGTRNGPACKPRKSREHGGPAGRAARPKEARGPGDQGDRPSWQWGRRSRGPQREGLCVGEGAGSVGDGAWRDRATLAAEPQPTQGQREARSFSADVGTSLVRSLSGRHEDTPGRPRRRGLQAQGKGVSHGAGDAELESVCSANHGARAGRKRPQRTRQTRDPHPKLLKPNTPNASRVM